MANNDKQWSSAAPGLLIILVDQSGSMMNEYIDGDSRTVFSAKVINRVINTIIKKNFNKDKPKNRCFITVLGYGIEVKELCSGYLEELYANPLRIEEAVRKVSDGDGGLVEKKVKRPIWVEPIDENVWTNMKDAFVMAKDLAQAWIADQKDRPAPVIINISDGEPYYDHKPISECIAETKAVAKEIMQLSNDDGHVLIFNAEIGTGGHKFITPADESEVVGEAAKFLFEISSVIPEGYKAAAVKNGLSVRPGSRGCVFNADAEELIKLIDFGSSKGQGDK
ncbi:MAG: VWA domain-containing protein [Bacteroidales bacterium]|nr:VWA domain-containing protein [Bacteroidales bacterium]